MDLQDWASIFQIFATCVIFVTAVIYWCLLKTAVKDLKRRDEESHIIARQNVWHDLFSTFDHINDYIDDHKDTVCLPYPETISGQQNVVLTFHHINLLLQYWVNRDILTETERIGFQRWMKKLFFKRIEENKKLAQDLKTIIDFGDLYPEDFLNWLKGQNEYQRILQSIGTQ